MTGRTLRCLGPALIGLLLCSRPGAVSAQSSRTPEVEAYLDAVAQYRAGRAATAVLHARQLDAGAVETAVRKLTAEFATRAKVCPERPGDIATATFLAAVLLHTEAALAALDLGDDGTTEAYANLDTAQQLMTWVVRKGSPCDVLGPTTERDWLLAVTLLTLRAWALPAADHFAGRLIRAAPVDADALYAAGAVHEAQVLRYFPDYPPPSTRPLRGSPFRTAGGQQAVGHLRGALERQHSLRELQRSRGQAARFFERALTTSPDRTDIRLRLGWVQFQIGRADESRRNLGAVASGAPAVSDRYLAELFLGRIAEHEGRLGAAVRHYEQAMRIEPEGHVAPTALAHALDRLGEIDLARRILVESVSDAHTSPDDPWSIYLHGPSGIGERLLDQLRERVTAR